MRHHEASRFFEGSCSRHETLRKLDRCFQLRRIAVIAHGVQRMTTDIDAVTQ
jgi:hypothetical protein